MGMSIAPARAKPGIAWMHASRDVLAALGEFRAGNLTAGQYLKSFTKRLAFANFAIDDPMPALVELPVAAWNRLAHTLRGKHAMAQKQMRRRLAK
jgi:predicted ATP-grasp superfamily ATP-dependent carboligase